MTVPTSATGASVWIGGIFRWPCGLVFRFSRIVGWNSFARRAGGPVPPRSAQHSVVLPARPSNGVRHRVQLAPSHVLGRKAAGKGRRRQAAAESVYSITFTSFLFTFHCRIGLIGDKNSCRKGDTKIVWIAVVAKFWNLETSAIYLLITNKRVYLEMNFSLPKISLIFYSNYFFHPLFISCKFMFIPKSIWNLFKVIRYFFSF